MKPIPFTGNAIALALHQEGKVRSSGEVAIEIRHPLAPTALTVLVDEPNQSVKLFLEYQSGGKLAFLGTIQLSSVSQAAHEWQTNELELTSEIHRTKLSIWPNGRFRVQPIKGE